MEQQRVKKLPWSRPLADLVPAVIDPVLARRGFSASNLILFWDDIAGERLAPVSRPVKVQWPVPRRSRAGEPGPSQATLVVRVEPGFALELQHLAPLVIERVNAYLGWRCISRLRLEQGPAGERPMMRRRAPPVDKAAEEAARNVIGTSVSGPLRQALAKLGARVLARG
jgi:hypothetical protein